METQIIDFSDRIYIICKNSQLQRHPDTIEPVMAAKKWTCTLAMGCYPGGLPFEREERSPILRSTEHPHPQAHIFQGQTQWRFQMRRPEPKLVTKTQLPSSIWASLCHLFDNLTAKGSPYLVTTVSAKLIMHGLSLLFFHLFPPSLFRACLPRAMLAMLPVAALYSQPLPLHYSHFPYALSCWLRWVIWQKESISLVSHCINSISMTSSQTKWLYIILSWAFFRGFKILSQTFTAYIV